MPRPPLPTEGGDAGTWDTKLNLVLDDLQDAADRVDPGASGSLRKNLHYGPNGPEWRTDTVIDIRDYGAIPDGTTDNLVAFNAAFAVVPAGGAVIQLDEGIYGTSDSLELPPRTVLRGRGKRATTILALAGFPTDDYLIYLDDGTNLSFDTRLEHLWVDANNITDSSAVRVRQCQEGTGATSVLTSGYKKYGWNLDDNSANMQFYDLEFYFDTVPISSFYVDPTGPGGAFHFHRVTFNGSAPAPKAMDVNAGVWTLDSVHIEQATIGIYCGPNSSGRASGISGSTGTGEVMRMESGGWTVAGILKGTATTTLADFVSGVSFTDAFINIWVANGYNSVRIGSTLIDAGGGSPEGVKTARVGSLYLRADGGANSTLYVKESGTGNTGWVAK